MSKSKNTKRALLASVMSMILCFTMLIGTTFAWFTDTASTGVNKIQAGTLKIGFEMSKDKKSWSDVGTEPLNFITADNRAVDKVLWEPGCTYKLPYIRIVNKGNLALKFKLLINGVKGDSKLAEVIDVKIGEKSYGTLSSFIKETEVDSDGAAHGIILPKDAVIPADETDKTISVEATDAYEISLHMQESADNTYQGLSIESMSFTVLATQYTHENDSFNNQYDKDAKYPTYIPADNVLDSTTPSTSLNGNIVVEAADNTLTFGNNADIGEKTAVDMKGTTQNIADSIKAQDGQSLTMVNGELVKSGSFGKVRFDTKGKNQEGIFENMTFTDTKAPSHTGTSSNDTEEMIQICPNGGGTGTYIFRNCTFNNANVGVNGMNNGADVELIFENCVFKNTGNADAIDIISNYASGKVTVKNCTFNLVTTSSISAVNIWGSQPFNLAFEGKNVVNGSVADSTYKVHSTTSVKAYALSGSGEKIVTGEDTVTVTGIAVK